MDDAIENVLPEQNKLELIAELRSVQTAIVQRVEEWKKKVNALEESVKFEQGEEEACSEKIEDTEEKCAAKQEDSLNQQHGGEHGAPDGPENRRRKKRRH